MATARLDPAKVTRLVVHCSASKPDQKVDASVINRWHRERGFVKIGYHYVINRDGKVEPGRTLSEVGAHVAGINSTSVGICLVGGLDANGKSADNFTPIQLEKLAAVLRELVVLFPKAEVVGHRDCPGVAKDCPCFDVRSWWKKVQQPVG